MKSMPKLKGIYEKYQDNLEILGINTRDDDQRWANAVKKHEMTWRQVKDDGSVNFSKLYAVTVYPTYVLITPDGKVVAYSSGKSEEFFNNLDSFLVK